MAPYNRQFPITQQEANESEEKSGGEEKEQRQDGKESKRTGRVENRWESDWAWLLNWLMEQFISLVNNPKAFKAPVNILTNNSSLLVWGVGQEGIFPEPLIRHQVLHTFSQFSQQPMLHVYCYFTKVSNLPKNIEQMVLRLGFECRSVICQNPKHVVFLLHHLPSHSLKSLNNIYN